MSTRNPVTGAEQRLFVSLDPPDAVREQIAAWQARASGAVLRAVRSEALHLTLAFLGDRDPGEVSRAIDIVGRADRRPVAVALRPDPVPVPKRRPRLYALAAESEAAVRLRAELGDELGREGLLEREDRPFWPHLTVLRVRRSSGVGLAPPPRFDGDGHAFGAVRVALYRSVLGAEPRYEALTHVDLPPIEDRG